MKIAHLTRSGSFRPQIEKSVAVLEDSDKVEIQLHPPGGYSGVIEVSIQNREERQFDAAVDLSDPSRFPARIGIRADSIEQGFF
jgi:hypothetical protein